MMVKYEKILDGILAGLTLVSCVGMLVVVVVQVLGRVVFSQGPAWTEEASRMFFVYFVSFAGGLAVRDKAYVRVDLLLERLPKAGRRILESLIHGVVAGFMILVAFYALDLVELGMRQKSPAMGVSMGWIFLSVFILPAGIGVYSVLEIVRLYCEKRGDG